MVLCIKVPMKEAERVKRYLSQHALLDGTYRCAKADGFLFFPVTREFSSSLPVEFVERAVERVAPRGRLKDVLEDHLTAEEKARFTSAFDVVGSIAIVEIEPELEEKKGLIAATILANIPRVTTVLQKAGGHEGERRTQRMKFLAGVDTRETIVVENGVRLHINVEEVYYSVRSATERKRIASLVKRGERVLVMFSGAAPYCCVIAKHTAAEVVGIELNEKGHELGLENVKLNKLRNVVLINDDVRHVVPILAERKITFDRIVMPLPHTGHDFLDEAFSVAHTGTVIHLSDFEREGEFAKAAEKADAGAKRNNKRIKVLGITPSGQHSPRLFRVCVDFVVLE